jgi:catechol 2,3-dioxygenase-like lactoylglutathione lyase family enzyme
MQPVQLKRLDHVNIYTAGVARLVDWYGRVLGLPAGDRPAFPFPGAWLYCGDVAAVHLIGVEKQPERAASLQLEHFAFTAVGLKDFVARLEREQVPYFVRWYPGGTMLQINVHDPDGNHIHVDFSGAEAEGIELRGVDPSATKAG